MDNRTEGLIGAGLAVAGAVALPWVTATTIFGQVNVSGWEGDGKIAAGIAVLGGVALLAGWGWRVVLACGVLGAALMGYEWWHLERTLGGVEGAVRASVGYGVYLALGGFVLVAVAGWGGRAEGAEVSPGPSQTVG